MPELQEAPSKIVVQNLPVGQLQPNQWNRKSFDPTALEDLTNSIKSVGVLEPLIVRPVRSAQSAVGSNQTANGELRTADSYEIASGNRRWLAAKAAGLAEVPCQVRDLTDQQVSEMNIVANIQREDVPPLEMARMVDGYMKQFNKDQQAAADEFGKSLEWVRHLVSFLTLPPEVQENGKALPLGWDQLRALKRANSEHQKQVAQELKDGTLKPHQVAKRCNQLKFSPKGNGDTAPHPHLPPRGGKATDGGDSQVLSQGSTPQITTAVPTRKTKNNGVSGPVQPTDLLGQLGTAVQQQVVRHAFGSGEVGAVVEGWIAKAKGLKMWQLALALPVLFFGMHFFWFLLNWPLHFAERATNRMFRQTGVASLPTGPSGSTLPVPSSNNSEPASNTFNLANLTNSVPIPMGLKAELAPGHKVVFKWDPLGPGYTYNVYSRLSWDKASGYDIENKKPMTSTITSPWKPNNLSETYQIVVTAVDKQGHESNYSDPITVDLREGQK